MVTKLGEKFIVRIDDRGRVLIPKKVRQKLMLGKGDRLVLEIGEDIVILRPIREVVRVRARELREVFFDAGETTFGE